MKTMIKLDSNFRIKNMACLYHAITSLGDIEYPVDVFISYDGNVTLSPSGSYADCISGRISIVRERVRGERTDKFSVYSFESDDYDRIVYDDYNCFYKLSLLEACHLILDIKDYFDIEGL